MLKSYLTFFFVILIKSYFNIIYSLLLQTYKLDNISKHCLIAAFAYKVAVLALDNLIIISKQLFHPFEIYRQGKQVFKVAKPSSFA